MFKEAVKVPRDADAGGDGPPPSQPKVPEQVARTLIEALLEVAPGQTVTREQVEQRYGKPVDRSRWQKVEDTLFHHPMVQIERGDKNKAIYRRAA